MSNALSGLQKDAFEDFYQGAMNKERDRVRRALTDDFTFVGPMMSFDEPEAFVDAMIAVDGVVTDSRIFASEVGIAHQYVLDVSAPFRASVPMCDIIEYRGDRISRVQLYTDPKLFGPGGA